MESPTVNKYLSAQSICSARIASEETVKPSCTQSPLSIFMSVSFLTVWNTNRVIFTTAGSQQLFQSGELYHYRSGVVTSRMSSWGAHSSRQHALHPQGLLWVVEAKKGRLAKTQHAPCQETRQCGVGGCQWCVSQHSQRQSLSNAMNDSDIKLVVI